MPIEQTVDRALFHSVPNLCLKSHLDLGSCGDLSAAGTSEERSEKLLLFFHAQLFMTTTTAACRLDGLDS